MNMPQVIPLFKSIIALGNFNPAILTPQFLMEHCAVPKEKIKGGQGTGIFTEITVDQFKISTLLDKMQIIYEKPTDMKDAQATAIMSSYLQTLSYTPLDKVGINFNFAVKDFDFSKLAQLFSDPKSSFVKKFVGETYHLDQQTNFNPKEARCHLIEIVYPSDGYAITRLNAQQLADGIHFNYNYEVNAGRDRNLYKKIIENEAKLFDICQTIMKELFSL